MLQSDETTKNHKNEFTGCCLRCDGVFFVQWTAQADDTGVDAGTGRPAIKLRRAGASFYCAREEAEPRLRIQSDAAGSSATHDADRFRPHRAVFKPSSTA